MEKLFKMNFTRNLQENRKVKYFMGKFKNSKKIHESQRFPIKTKAADYDLIHFSFLPNRCHFN